MRRTIFSFFVVLILAGNLAAQTSAPGVPFVTTKYDKFEDRTSISADVRLAKIYDPDSPSTLQPGGPWLSARFDCPGHSAKCAAPWVMFTYPAGAQSLARCDAMDVIFIADGVRIKVGQCRWDGGVVVMFDVGASDFGSRHECRFARQQMSVRICAGLQ